MAHVTVQLHVGVRLQPTVRLHRPITPSDYNFRDELEQNTAVYAPITFEGIVNVMISNSNWTEWNTIQGVIVRVISKLDKREREADLKLQSSTITPFITYGAKLLNADWLRQRAFFLNHEGTFGNQEGVIN